MICKGCGHSVDESAQVCGHCGRTLLNIPEDSAPAKPESKKPCSCKRKPKRWIIPACAVIVLLIVCSILLITNLNTKTVYLRTKIIRYNDHFSKDITVVEYDDQGRLIRYTCPDSFNAINYNNSESVLSYEYEGKKLSKILIQDSSIQYTLFCIYKGDRLEQIVSEIHDDTSYYYEANCDTDGNITELVFYRNTEATVHHTFTYHPGGQLHTHTRNHVLLNTSYQTVFDERGNKIRYTVHYGTSSTPSSATEYTYNERGWLTGTQLYDSHGWRVSNQTISYKTDKDGVPTQIHFSLNGREFTLEGEKKGQRVVMYLTDGTQDVPKDLMLELKYDENGNLVLSKIVGGGMVHHYCEYEYTKLQVSKDYTPPLFHDPIWMIDYT